MATLVAILVATLAAILVATLAAALAAADHGIAGTTGVAVMGAGTLHV